MPISFASRSRRQLALVAAGAFAFGALVAAGALVAGHAAHPVAAGSSSSQSASNQPGGVLTWD